VPRTAPSIGALIGALAGSVLAWTGDLRLSLLLTALFTAVLILGARLATRARRRRRPAPLPAPWAVVATALLALGAGADVPGLALLAIGLTGAIGARYPGRALDALSLSGIGVASACAVGWSLLPDEWPGFGAALTVALALLVIGLASSFLFTTTERLEPQVLILVGSVAVAVGTAVTAATVLGAGCLAAACLHPSMRELLDPVSPEPLSLGRWRPWLLLWAVSAGGIGAAAGTLIGGEPSVIPVALITSTIGVVAVLYVARLLRNREQLEWHGHHDELTGLPSRVVFEERLNMALAHARRSQTTVAVMFLDLDRFKLVNDSLGHAEGNRLLREAARRVRRALREGDTAARFGGDEFALLCPHIGSAEEAVVIAERLLTLFTGPFRLDRRELVVTTSIGIALYPNDGRDGDTLVRHADAAMYRAKDSGRNAYHLFSHEITASNQERMALEGQLHEAIARGELELHYQPKVHIDSGRIVGVEALVRWRHPERGLLGPERFVTIAEEFGQIGPLGEWVLTEACRQAEEWNRSGFRRMTVGVNVSPRQLKDGHFAEIVERVLEETGFDARYLELELTEGMAMDTSDQTMADLYAIGRLGVQCSIDDFGTGYSSLSYLTRLPIKTLKIDKSFVMRIGPGQEGDDAAIVRAVIAMAHSLGLQVVAEGVETSHQAEFLQRYSCDYIQGFLVSGPLPAQEFETFLMLHQVSSKAYAS
jgi:diguanylate cyclase (GGDEF)-like protein